jgi:hypothetical protein
MLLSFLGCATLEDARTKIKGKVEAYQSLMAVLSAQRRLRGLQ